MYYSTISYTNHLHSTRSEARWCSRALIIHRKGTKCFSWWWCFGSSFEGSRLLRQLSSFRNTTSTTRVVPLLQRRRSFLPAPPATPCSWLCPWLGVSSCSTIRLALSRGCAECLLPWGLARGEVTVAKCIIMPPVAGRRGRDATALACGLLGAS